MKKSKIYISNFPAINASSNFAELQNNRRNKKFIYGYDLRLSYQEVESRIFESILTSILVYDKLQINAIEVLSLAKLFGLDDTLGLLRSNSIEIINDSYVHPCVSNEGKYYKAGCLISVTKSSRDHDLEFERLEAKLIEQYPSFKTKVDKIVLLSEDSQLKLNPTEIESAVLNEINYDLKNANILDTLGISSFSNERILEKDVLKIIRLLDVNKNLITASMAKSDNIVLDFMSENYLNSKLTPIQKKSNLGTGLNVFKEILQKKGIPNFSKLYKEKILTLNDILEIRNNLDGKVFRNWFLEEQYNEDEILKTILNTRKPSLSNGISKHIRWFYPTLLKFVSAPLGIAASYAESFIVNKLIAGGWHPNLFLDKKLKNKIDIAVLEFDKKQNEKRIKDRFNHVGRNEQCPCGSGKKYKHCHLK